MICKWIKNNFDVVGIGECDSTGGASGVNDFGGEYGSMLSQNRYTVNTSNTPPSVQTSTGVEMNVGGSSVDSHHHSSAHYLQTNGAGATISSAQLFHPHAAIGHFSTPTATYIPGTGSVHLLTTPSCISSTSWHPIDRAPMKIFWISYFV